MPIQTPLQDIADAVFVNSIPNYQSFEKLFVYTFNASCSSCIAMAMDCFKAYKKSGVSIPFVFLSKEENREIFHYYYESEYGEEPPCYYSLESRELQDGIYTIEDYLVKFYNDWNQYRMTRKP